MQAYFSLLISTADKAVRNIGVLASQMWTAFIFAYCFFMFFLHKDMLRHRYDVAIPINDSLIPARCVVVCLADIVPKIFARGPGINGSQMFATGVSPSNAFHQAPLFPQLSLRR